MNLNKLLDTLHPVRVMGDANYDVSGIACDSRHVKPGNVFVAIEGHRKDGCSFVSDAIERGATVIVSDEGGFSRVSLANGKKSDSKVCYVGVEDTRAAAASLASAFHDHPSRKLQMVGVTGTNGKTTTSYMVRNILREADRNPGIISTVCYEFGERVIPAVRTTPDAPYLQDLLSQMVSNGCRSAVMEVSSHALAQQRTKDVQYDVAVFTNLTRDHLDYHRTMEEYFEAKALLFQALGEKEGAAGDLAAPSKTAVRKLRTPVAVINMDDPWGRKLAGLTGLNAEVITYSMSLDALVRAEEIALTAEGSSFVARTPWGDIEIKTRMMGRYNVSNSLAAIASCGALGVDLGLIAKVFSSMEAVPGRLEQVEVDADFQVFVDYAHTDDALENVLGTLREITGRRLIVVFGCGGDRDRTKRPAMGEIASQLADHSVLTSDNPRRENPMTIIQEIRDGFGRKNNYEIVEDRKNAIKRALEIAHSGDVVLIAGKGHENFQEFANKTISFDDRAVVKTVLSEIS